MTMNNEPPPRVLHWNYRGFTEFPISRIKGDETEITDIYLKENLISKLPTDISRLIHLESLYLSGNDIAELPAEISRLQSLKCLDVSGNRLQSLPEEIGELRSLKFLILDENELSALPLRLAELRMLQYLSVCDNKLRWVPQRPAFNMLHCELRCWRNTRLESLPHYTWYHMLRGPLRCLNIGCNTLPRFKHIAKERACRIKIVEESRVWEIDVDCPQHRTIQHSDRVTPPSLYELSRRNLYQTISEVAKKLSSEHYSFYSDHRFLCNHQRDLGNEFQGCNLTNKNEAVDINGNDAYPYSNNCINSRKVDRNVYYVPKDIVQEYFSYLPRLVKEDLWIGPASRCENVLCQKPIFDYALYEFCLGKLTLLDSTEDIILSAALCSKACADDWKKSQRPLTWTLVNQD